MKPARMNWPIVVIGGGPAGVFTAAGLSELGHDVLILSRPRPYCAWEGLSERPRRSLQHFDFTETLAGIGPLVTREAHWNGVVQLQNREYILDRRLFDRGLLRDARRKGVRVIEGRVTGVSPLDPGWEISYVTDRGKGQVTAAFLVEARGRESALGRKRAGGAGNLITAPATSALLKSYDMPRDRPALTAVASFAGGWVWHVRDGRGAAILQIFISSERGELPPKAKLNDFFTELAGEIPEAVGWLDGARPRDGRVSVRAAAARLAGPAGGDDYLVVGDGAMALDPLSGNGIFYAIGSGLAAAPVINTLLNKPQDREAALRFHQQRIDVAFQGGCAMGREFYAAESRWPESRFWSLRRHWPPGAAASHPDPLSQPAAVREMPVVRDGYIERRKVIVTADHPRGVWRLDGVPLIALLELMAAGAYDDRECARRLGVGTAAAARARKWLEARKLTDIMPKSA